MNKGILSNDKGFSLVEIMTAIVIVGMIMGVISSFMLVHIKSYETTQKVVDVQYEAQIALNQIVGIAMASKGIYLVKDTTTDAAFPDGVVTKSNNERIPYLLVFLNDNGTYDVFKTKTANGENIIYYANRSNLSDFTALINSDEAPSFMNVFAKYVDIFKITPMIGKSYEDSKTVQLSMAFKNGDVTFDAVTEVKFRNKE